MLTQSYITLTDIVWKCNKTTKNENQEVQQGENLMGLESHKVCYQTTHYGLEVVAVFFYPSTIDCLLYLRLLSFHHHIHAYSLYFIWALRFIIVNGMKVSWKMKCTKNTFSLFLTFWLAFDTHLRPLIWVN
jgi:hypothetical protein